MQPRMGDRCLLQLSCSASFWDPPDQHAAVHAAQEHGVSDIEKHPMHSHVSRWKPGMLPTLDPISDLTLFFMEQSSKNHIAKPEQLLRCLIAN